MADWLLTDYIGGDNVEEACDLLAARKRLSGVGRKTSPEMLERWIQQGACRRRSSLGVAIGSPKLGLPSEPPIRLNVAFGLARALGATF